MHGNMSNRARVTISETNEKIPNEVVLLDHKKRRSRAVCLFNHRPSSLLVQPQAQLAVFDFLLPPEEEQWRLLPAEKKGQTIG